MPNTEFKESTMIRLKKTLRIVLMIAAVFAVFIVISGIWYARYFSTFEPDMTPSFLDDTDVETAMAFIDRQKLRGQKTAPSKPVDDMQLLMLGYDAGMFREGAVVAPNSETIATLPQVAPGALDDLLTGEISEELPVIWPYVMAGSFMVLGNSLGDHPVVAFYNPYFDVALLTKWEFKDFSQTEEEIGFKLVEAVPVTGRAFIENRSTLATDQPVWAGSDALLEIRLGDAATDFVAAFETRYAPLGRASSAQFGAADVASKSTAIAVAEKRVFHMLRWVIDAQNPDAPVNYAAEIKQLKAAFSARKPRRLNALLPSDNPQTAEMFFQLGSDIREGLKPYLVIDKNVIFVDPINLPTAAVSVYFEPVEGQANDFVPGLVWMFSLDSSVPGN